MTRLTATVAMVAFASLVGAAAVPVAAEGGVGAETLRLHSRAIDRAVREQVRHALRPGMKVTPTTTARLRAGPGTDSRVIASLPPGSPLTVTGSGGDENWVQVAGTRHSGYVWASLLEPVE